jgi:hypothetical protein
MPATPLRAEREWINKNGVTPFSKKAGDGPKRNLFVYLDSTRNYYIILGF